jgi:hypothetical protein
VRDPGRLWLGLRATYDVLGRDGAGRGLPLIALGLLVSAALILVPLRHKAFLRSPLTTFAPLVLLLVCLRDDADPASLADVIRRMLALYVPLALLFVMAAVASADAVWRSAGALVRPRHLTLMGRDQDLGVVASQDRGL